METIIYRPIKKDDYEQVKSMICKAFSLDKYITDSKLLETVKAQYLYSCLLEATYTCVTEKDGKVIGVIMGNAQNDFSMAKHLPYGMKFLWNSLKINLYGMKCASQASGYKNLHAIYHEFSAKHKGEFDGVLTLFAVNEECRGLGVGRKLLDNLMDYLKEKKVKCIYLYTDTTCTYEFYEHRGFERIESKSLELEREGKPFNMDVFLYSYSISQNGTQQIGDMT